MLTSKQNAKIKHLIQLKQRKYRQKNQEFIIEGPHLVDMAITKAYPIKEIYLTKEINEAKYGAYAKEYISHDLASYISDTQENQGIYALCPLPKENFYLTDEVYRSMVILDGVQDPGNLGTIIRTSDAFGFKQILLGKGTADPYNAKVLRSAQGSHFNVQLLQVDLIDAITKLQAQGYHIYATALNPKATALNELKRQSLSPFAIIFGNEGAGVSSKLLEMADEHLYIPMTGEQESLNVAIAAAICLYSFQNLI